MENALKILKNGAPTSLGSQTHELFIYKESGVWIIKILSLYSGSCVTRKIFTAK